MKSLHYIQRNVWRRFVIVKRIINLKTSIMKKILKFCLVVVAVLTAMNASASGNDFTIDVKKGEGKAVTFALNESNKVMLSIYNLDNELIHQEKVNSKGSINRTYDLNALPQGIYFLVAESDAKIAKYKISVIGETAVLGTKAVSEVYKPVLINNAGLVTVSFNNTYMSPVSIKIFNESEELVYSESLLDQKNIEMIFDIKKLPFETYSFIVSYDDDRLFEKTVSAK